MFDIRLFKSREAKNKKAATDIVTAFAAVGGVDPKLAKLNFHELQTLDIQLFIEKNG